MLSIRNKGRPWAPILEELNMEQTRITRQSEMTTNEKWVLASTAAGFSLENMARILGKAVRVTTNL